MIGKKWQLELVNETVGNLSRTKTGRSLPIPLEFSNALLKRCMTPIIERELLTIDLQLQSRNVDDLIVGDRKLDLFRFRPG